MFTQQENRKPDIVLTSGDTSFDGTSNTWLKWPWVLVCKYDFGCISHWLVWPSGYFRSNQNRKPPGHLPLEDFSKSLHLVKDPEVDPNTSRRLYISPALGKPRDTPAAQSYCWEEGCLDVLTSEAQLWRSKKRLKKCIFLFDQDVSQVPQTLTGMQASHFMFEPRLSRILGYSHSKMEGNWLNMYNNFSQQYVIAKSAHYQDIVYIWMKN